MREKGMRSIVSKKYKVLNKVSKETEELINELNRDFKSEKYEGKISKDKHISFLCYSQL